MIIIYYLFLQNFIKKKKEEKEKLERIFSLQILSEVSNAQSIIEAKSQLYKTNTLINQKNKSSKEINLYVRVF